MDNVSERGQSGPINKGPFSLKEIVYRILALIFLLLVIGAVLFIAEASAATTYEATYEICGYVRPLLLYVI